MYHGKVSFQDAYNMPVNLRSWWIKRINWTMEEQRKAEEKAQKDSKAKDKLMSEVILDLKHKIEELEYKIDALIEENKILR